MNGKTNAARKQVKSEISIFERDDVIRKAEEIRKKLESRTWRELETAGRFKKDEKLSFVTDDMLIVGCDIGSEIHYIRAIDTRGREFSKKAFGFSNTVEGFERAKTWALRIAAAYDKTQIVWGLEPTGHYWFCLASWLVKNGISVVQVNPYAVKQTKELEDNSQRKDDLKDPKLIANLVKDGNFGMPYLPESVYADLRNLSSFRDQLTEGRIRETNRLHREMKIFFPEYKEAFGKVEGAFCLDVLQKAPFPEDITKIGADGIRDIWHEAKRRGRSYGKAEGIVEQAKKSVGLKEGVDVAKLKVVWLVEEIIRINKQIKEVESLMYAKMKELPYAEEVLKIPGIGDNILSGILAEIGDMSRFDDAKEIQKLAGLGLVACSSGKHKGETKISHRGRKRLRYWLYQAAMSAVAHSDEFKELHKYYTTRDENPLQKMQSLMAVAGKLLRVIYAIMKTGQPYDKKKLLADIKRPVKTANAA